VSFEAMIRRALAQSGSVPREKVAGGASGWGSLARSVCSMVGGPGPVCQAVGRAVDAFFAAADALDDVEDEDGDEPLWQTWGVGPAVNAGSALVLLSFRRLLETPLHGTAPDRVVMAGRLLAAAGYRAARGQHLDLTMGSSARLNLSQYLRIVQMKSGSLVAGACAAAAALGGGDRHTCALTASMGLHLGTALQISNDSRSLKDPRRLKGDWLARKRTLPVLFALRFPEDPVARRFQRLFNAAAGDDSAQLEAVSLLEKMYAFDFADRVRDDEVRVALDRIQALRRRGFDTPRLEKVMGSV